MISKLFLFFALFAIPAVHAFGAGEIGEVSNQAGKAFRHGDIEAVIEGLAKSVGHSGHALLQGIAGAVASGSLSGLAHTIQGSRSATFTARDVTRIYFGNWLRDYSQAMDIGGLTQLTADSILLLISVLSFLTFGYGTKEWEVTKQKLNVYLLTEHIDNPLGYDGAKAQSLDSRLRPPVDERRELAIDPRTGMKAYIASDGQGFDTSTECVRRSLRKCIELGRRGQQEGDKMARYEAYRLLGTALHTLEDLAAHSNFVELCLVKMGHREVYCYVGERCQTRAPDGQSCPPLITGSFGGTDFIFSMLGEGSDKLSSSTLTTLQTKMDEAQQSDTQSLLAKVQSIMSKLPKSSDDSQNKAQQLQDIKNNAINLNPDTIIPEQAQQVFLQALTIRDEIMSGIEDLLEQFPIIQEFLGDLQNAMTVLVMSAVEPYIAPLLGKLVDGLSDGSEAVLNWEDQTKVFEDPDCSDPTHSVISKDHFSNILNFVAGKVAISVVKNVVPMVVEAWCEDNVNPEQTIDTILEALHHPYFAQGRSRIQRDMFEAVQEWFQGLPNQRQVLQKLTKESVRAGNNKIEGSASMGTLGHGCAIHGGAKPSQRFHKYNASGRQPMQSAGRRTFTNQTPHHGFASEQEFDNQFSRPAAAVQENSFGYNPSAHTQSSGGRRIEQEHSYHDRRNNEESRFNSGNRVNQSNEYVSGGNDYGRSSHSNAYEERRNDGYGSQNQQSSYENRVSAGNDYDRNETQSYGRSDQSPYGRQEARPQHRQEPHHDGRPSFGERNDSDRFGAHERMNDYENDRRPKHGPAYDDRPHGGRRHQQEENSYAENNQYGERSSRHHQHEQEDESFGVGRMNLQEGSGRREHGGRREHEGRGDYEYNSEGRHHQGRQHNGENRW